MEPGRTGASSSGQKQLQQQRCQREEGGARCPPAAPPSGARLCSRGDVARHAGGWRCRCGVRTLLARQRRRLTPPHATMPQSARPHVQWNSLAPFHTTMRNGVLGHSAGSSPPKTGERRVYRKPNMLVLKAHLRVVLSRCCSSCGAGGCDRGQSPGPTRCWLGAAGERRALSSAVGYTAHKKQQAPRPPRHSAAAPAAPRRHMRRLPCCTR